MIVLNNKNNNIDKMIFVVSLFMLISRKYITAFFFDYPSLMNVQSYLLYLPLALLLGNFMLNKYHTKKEIFLLAILATLYVFTRDGSILIFMLMALGIRAIDDKYVVQSYFNIHIAFFILYVFLSLVLPDFGSQGEYHYTIENGVKVLRGTFGLSNPNAAFYYLLPIYASYIYLRFEKYNLWDRILLIALTVLIYDVTYSRTGLIAVLGGLVFIEIMKRVDLKKQAWIGKLIKFTPLIFVGISISVGTIFHNMDFLNRVLSSRPRNWYIYLVARGNIFSLFGNKYVEAVRNMNPLDNSYIYLLCFLGIIAFALLMYAIYKGLESFIEENNKKYIAIAMLFFIYALAENILLEVSLNFALLLIIKRFIMIGNENKINMYNYKNYKEDIIYIKKYGKSIKNKISKKK